MRSQRLPALVLLLAALGFLIWGVLLVLAPGGSEALEWVILGLAAVTLVFGALSTRRDHPQRATVIRLVLTGFAVFGALVVIGLTADDSSSRTWFRLGWAALIAGYVAAVLAWWGAPQVDIRSLIAGGVLGLVVIGSGVGITVNCDESLQRSWCDPVFEQEETLASRVEVDGVPDHEARAGGNTGPYLRAFLVDDTDIEEVIAAPEPFSFEERPLQSIEVARGRYTAGSGPDSNCQIDAKVETAPVGYLLTLTASCESG